ncbi:type IV pilus assembly protein PilA [Eubacterium ruminantium]|uniref:Type IV pilus assembly protein PilA n=1 Tax=Eubacterium ruminantium TaxID=42322 RepID=A0A1T4MJK5_9FIRM|nr:prepilin-type N-terminal cleavage/methylation domain-containing protein [Eubacterium ruminantium]SCW48470.1 type IV pilus assembly protein PilA [Eubacterium ruminantium]SDM57597.1 type IV pilus assembly protein PilA [Eubacterium ruminantium]SJZ67015.1 type IV pilus assembly protein PilA [Eubacterium ruminantium]
MKKTNRGFSLVELIIVIAIMAILAAAIAPALIRYIDKSRRADDVTAAGTVLTGVQTAMADEDCYSEIAKATSGQIICSVKGGKKGNVAVTAIGDNLKSEMESTLAGGCDIKYTKDKAAYYNVTVNGEVLSVYIGKDATNTEWEIQPVTCKKYK